jgi:amidase
MTPDDYRRHDALGLAALIARGEAAAAEVAGAALARIAALGRLNAVIRLDAGAPAGAAGAGPGAAGGPLVGVPFLLKDVNLFAADSPTRFASRFFAEAAPKDDSTLVARWRRAGLAILGRTNTPEFAGDFITEPLAYGPVLNPWDEGLTAGGSSGGAAAAVAAGLVPLAHGTDLGGSIRIPAACCGVFGFKPTTGLNPLGPHWEEIASGLDADHVLTRSVRDSAAALDATAGAEPGGPPVALPPGGFLAGLDVPLPHLRIGLATAGPSGEPAAPAHRAAAEAVAGLLAGLGHEVVPFAFPAEADPGPWFDLLWTPDLAYLVRERAAELGRGPRADELEPLTWAMLRLAEGASALDLLRARLRRRQAARALALAAEGIDLVLSPALAEDPPPLGALTFAAQGFDLGRWAARGYRFAPFAAPANLWGAPAASCPVRARPGGPPLSVQIMAAPGRDLSVLRAARLIEEATDWRAVAGLAPV